MFRKCLLLSTALFAAAACMPLSATSLVDIDLIDRDNGHTLPEYTHRGRIYVPGVPGHRYGVRLTNTSGERVLVVLSVDGVNAVSGKTAHPAQTGYVLAPWQSTEINGWRKSLDDVAQFYFTDLPDSYAARTGRPDNVGVIGIAVFRERQQVIPYPQPVGPPIARGDAQANRVEGKASAPAAAPAREASAASDSAYGQESRPRLGTGHGAREWAPVGQTGFVRASRSPVQLTQLRYDDLDALAAMGVLPRPQPYWGRDEPRAFPGSFVADPPAW